MSATPGQEKIRKEQLERLRRGEPVTDLAFDRMYPEKVRKASSTFWTPIFVSKRAAQLFASLGKKRVLDVGAGVGKFCFVAALSTDELTLTGLEHRGHLVEIANGLIQQFDIPRVRMVHGGLWDIDFEAFAGFYVFNPFQEATLAPKEWLDKDIDLSADQAARDIALFESFCARARRGTLLVTYYGFGGAMPEGWILRAELTSDVRLLRCWERG